MLLFYTVDKNEQGTNLCIFERYINVGPIDFHDHTMNSTKFLPPQ